jgi:hypothetical protein
VYGRSSNLKRARYSQSSLFTLLNRIRNVTPPGKPGAQYSLIVNGLSVMGYGLSVMGYGLRVKGYGLSVMGYALNLLNLLDLLNLKSA